jgi:uncharacterized protein (TIGR03382 family)
VLAVGLAAPRTAAALPGVRVGATSLVLAVGLAAPRTAAALPGVMVGATPLVPRNRTTQVVVVHDGRFTAVTVQPDYQGPPHAFALVLPVPGEVRADEVRILDRRLLERLDRVGAPRLTDVWEQDPCPRPPPRRGWGALPGEMGPATGGRAAPTFQLGEYVFHALGRVGAGELDAWMREEGLPLTEAATRALAPYVAAGMHFLVARVDPGQVHFNARGEAVLSPLRYHYEADGPPRLPLRAGLLNSAGTQELVVHVLARGRRGLEGFEDAAMPGEVAVTEAARERFGEVYAGVFAAAAAQRPGAAFVEYVGSAGGLTGEELAALGLDVVPVGRDSLTLTRLHLRYAPAGLEGDPALRPAAGPEQATRFVVRHPWVGEVTCAAPERGRWGEAPPDGGEVPEPRRVRARSEARAPGDLEDLLAEDVPALGLRAREAGCGCAAGAPASPLALLLLVARRRRRS